MKNLIKWCLATVMVFFQLAYIRAQQVQNMDEQGFYNKNKLTLSRILTDVYMKAEGGKLKVYANDSLKTVLTPNQIHQKFSVEMIIQVQDSRIPDDPYAFIDTLVYAALNPENDITGCYALYRQKNLAAGCQYDLSAIALTYTLNINGIEFLRQSLFFVTPEDLKRVLNPMDYQFLMSGFSTYSLLGIMDNQINNFEVDNAAEYQLQDILLRMEQNSGFRQYMTDSTLQLVSNAWFASLIWSVPKTFAVGKIIYQDKDIKQPYSGSLDNKKYVKLENPRIEGKPVTYKDTMLLVMPVWTTQTLITGIAKNNKNYCGFKTTEGDYYYALREDVMPYVDKYAAAAFTLLLK